LNDKSKDKAREMKDSDGPISNSPKYTKKKKGDPKKMNQDNKICKNLVEHFSN
jgi:hypothetical protein